MNMLKNFWNHRIGTAESPEITIVSPTENYYLLGGGGESLHILIISFHCRGGSVLYLEMQMEAVCNFFGR